ncbi:MAG TPA: lactate utilization protein C [Longimicrobiales bacterium]
MSTAREEILARIRGALGSASPAGAPIPRAYRQVAEDTPEERLERFAERVAEYRASVRRCDEAGLPATIAEACAARGVKRLVVPPDVPETWIPAGVQPLRDPGLSNADLDAADGVLTGCALGIAETGTIVLDGGARQGRRALSLLPDYHLCVVFAHQVVGIVPEAIERLRPAVAEGRPITFISGPSATSDIELSRVEGVHGPRTLEVVIVR